MDFVPFNDPSHPELMPWAASINNQANATRVPPCAIAAVISRETSGQNILQIGVPPGPGCGVGLAQITAGVDWTNLDAPLYRDGSEYWALKSPSANLYVAGRFFLRPAIEKFMAMRAQYADAMARWSDQILFFVFAAYNAGPDAIADAIMEGTNPDAITTEGNYGSDTLARYTALVAASHAQETP